MTVEKIYWDSDCFLAHLKGDREKAEQCDGVIQRGERGEVIIVTSALTLAEVLWVRSGPRIPTEKAQIVRKFFRRSFIRIHNVTRKISELAQDLVWEHSIKPKDAIHVATAIHIGVDAFETFDKKLVKKSGTVGKPLLLIREPEAAAQGRLHLPSPPHASE